MAILLLGLVVFLSAHTFTTLREPRARIVDRLGENGYKAAYSLVSLVGLVLIVWGFGEYRAGGMIPVWSPPTPVKHVALTLMLPAMILLVAAYAPPGEIRYRARHPMLLAVKIWAFSHFLANGDLGSMILFAGFLAWAVYDRISLKRREGISFDWPRGWSQGDTISVILGTGLWLAFLFGLHRWLIGVGVV